MARFRLTLFKLTRFGFGFIVCFGVGSIDLANQFFVLCVLKKIFSKNLYNLNNLTRVSEPEVFEHNGFNKVFQ